MNMSIPVLIERIGSRHWIRPLFLAEPVEYHTDLNRCITRFTARMRKLLAELGREDRQEELAHLLAGPRKRPVLLLGPPKVGKTSIVLELIHQRMRAGGGRFRNKQRVWFISPQRLISGMSYVGQWEERLLAILKECRKHDHILFFDDLLGLYTAGVSAESSLSVAHILKPHIEDNEVRVLAEMTHESLRVLQEKDRGLADLFHMIA